MATAIGAQLSKLRGNLVLNLLIIVFLVGDAAIGAALVSQGARADEARPLLTAPAEPAAPATTVAAGDQGVEPMAALEVGEQLRSAIVVAQALELQKGDAIDARDLSIALPVVSFTDEIAGAGTGVVGVASTEEGILLLTRSPEGGWACAAASSSGDIGFGFAPEREVLESVTGCLTAAG